MPWNLNMIFSGIFENIWHWEHSTGGIHLATKVEGVPYPPRRAPRPRGPTVALLHLSFHPHTPSSSHKHKQLAQTRVQARFASIFDLLAQKWQQNDLGLGFELDIRVWGRKKECVGERISRGGPPWAHEVGACPGGRACPWPLWPGASSSCCVLSAKYSQIFQKKSYLNFRAFGELLFSGYFYIARINQKTDRKYYFTLFQLNNRK